MTSLAGPKPPDSGGPVDVHPLVADNLRLLGRGEEVLASLDDGGWIEPGAMGAIGAHHRHILDHYTALLRGIESGVVEYESRDRDARVELDRGFALRASQELRAALAGIDPERPVLVRLRAGAEADLDVGAVPSTVLRELVFVLLHTVHHQALVAAELRRRGHDPGPELGVAPATLGHRRRVAAP
jgi:uncharacterized damage-inducible protein DinB